MERIRSLNLRYIIVAIVFIIICVISYFCMNTNDKNELIDTNYDLINTQTISTTDENQIESFIYVHIIGEVQNPGVYEIQEGARVKDIISIAGGTTEMADMEKINLAYQLSDGQKIKIPNKNDKVEYDEYVITDNNNSTKNKININNAKEQELQTITGIGPSTASKIVQYRKENGKFRKIEDIKNVPGIGDAKFNAIKEQITV